MGQIKNIKLHIVTDIKKINLCPLTLLQHGECSKNQKNLLQGHQVSKTHSSQSHPVQDSEETYFRQGTKTLRAQTVWLWWTNKTYPSQESQDHKEDCIAYGMFRVQVPKTSATEKMQALRIGR